MSEEQDGPGVCSGGDSKLGGGTSRRTRLLGGLAMLGLSAACLFALEGLVRLTGAEPPTDVALDGSLGEQRPLYPFVEDGAADLTIPRERTTPRVEPGEGPGHYRMFPAFRPATVARAKPQGSYRLVALGGSTTYGLWVGASQAFPSVLAARLEEQLGAPVEVVNLGVPGWDVDRVQRLVPTVAELDPDLIVLYTGHNELLAPEAAGAQAGDRGGSSLEAWRRGLLGVSATVRWLDYFVYRATHGRRELGRPVAVDREREDPVRVVDMSGLDEAGRTRPDADAVRQTADEFGQGLRQLTLALRRQAPLLVMMPVSNLIFPPLEGPSDIGAGPRGNHGPAGNVGPAGDAGAPAARFTAGLRLLRSGQADEALAELVAARDGDFQTHRMPSALAAEVGPQTIAERTALIDARRRFWDLTLEHGATALFVDHLHPTPRGHELLAERLITPALAALASDPWGRVVTMPRRAQSAGDQVDPG